MHDDEYEIMIRQSSPVVAVQSELARQGLVLGERDVYDNGHIYLEFASDTNNSGDDLCSVLLPFYDALVEYIEKLQDKIERIRIANGGFSNSPRHTQPPGETSTPTL